MATETTGEAVDRLMGLIADYGRECNSNGSIRHGCDPETLADIRAALQSAISGKWLGIAECPKDSRVLLNFPAPVGVGVGRWSDDRYAKKPRPYWTAETERIWGTLTIRANQPTRYMPLPLPPEEAK